MNVSTTILAGAVRRPALISVVALLTSVACGSSDRTRRVNAVGDGGLDASGPTADGAPPAPDSGRPPVGDAGRSPPDASADAPGSLPEASSDAGGEAGDGSSLLTGSYVNPSTGVDTNDGSQGAPFRTIQKAAAVVVSGQAIFLEDGVYDASTQGAYGITVPAGVHVIGLSAAGVTLQGAASDNAFLFQGGGGIANVSFDGFAQGVNVSGSGSFDVRGVQFNAVGLPFSINGALAVTIDASTSGPFISNVPATGFGVGAALVDGTSDVTVTGGSIANVTTAGGAMFLVRGSGKLTLDGMTLDTLKRHAIAIYDNADVSLRNVSITGVAISSSGMDNTVIAMGGQNTADPIDPSLSLDSTSITNNQVSAIALSLYGNLASKPLIQLTNSHLDGNTGYGIVAQTPGSTDPGLVFSLALTNTTVKNDTAGGIASDIGTFTIDGGEISGNGADGIQLSGASFTNSLKVRGGTAIAGNAGHGISFAGTASSVLDLGKAGDTGGIVFSAVAASHAAVNLLAPIQGFAVGNTWVPNVQGSSAQGTFTGAVTLPGNSSGANAILAAGASLVVSQ